MADPVRACVVCGEQLAPDKRSHAKFCSRKCANRFNQRSPEQERIQNLWRKFKITAETYDALLLQQCGACAICRTTESGSRWQQFWHVDHDHKTGAVRGLLCNRCNLALGQFRDDAEILRDAAEYIRADHSLN